MRELVGGIGAVLAVLFLLAQIVFWGGTSLGVVREHCVDLDTATASSAEVDSNWTYILWPPLTFANIDPAGTCVRNSPLREALSELGIWELPPPEEQVRDHIEEQLNDR